MNRKDAQNQILRFLYQAWFWNSYRKPMASHEMALTQNLLDETDDLQKSFYAWECSSAIERVQGPRFDS